VRDLEELNDLDAKWLEEGYEGSVICDPLGIHKQGRSTVREGGKLRIKRFVDAEAVVIGVTEGETNLNEAKINELGLTERSTHQANMVPNGMVGTLTCQALADIEDKGGLLIAKGQEVTVSAGRLTADERRHYLANPAEIVGRTIKFQFFPKGIKDKPRFPTFQSFRAPEDM
jgi:DNA ligase-1